MRNSFQAGVRVKAFGEVKRGRHMPEIHHPEYQIVRDNAPIVLEETLTPIYSTTEGAQTKFITKINGSGFGITRQSSDCRNFA